MADAVAKKEKIAAARKKLKQFQKGGTKTPIKSTPSGSPASTNRSSPVPPQTNGRGDTKYNGSNSMHMNGPQTINNNLETPEKQKIQSKPQQFTPQSSAIPNSLNSSSVNDSSVYSTPNAAGAVPQSHGMSASTERLQQLSRQINGIISQSSAYLNNEENTSMNAGVEELERRNRELASLLQQHSQINEQLNKQLVELKTQSNKLQSSLDGERKSFEDRLKRELGALKEQLQVHIQTIGILVAEKTELQSSLGQTQKLSSQRTEEVEELSGRLKASRQRVADLERSFTTASTSSSKHEQKLQSVSKEHAKEVDRLKLELYKLNKSNEELNQSVSELQGKLQSKVSECAKLEDSLIDTKGKLEMSDLRIQQLSGGESILDNSVQIDQLVTEKSELQAKAEQYEEAFHKVTIERDQIAQQYQQYIEQLNSQQTQLQTQVATLIEERESLVEKQTELQGQIQEVNSKQHDNSVSSAEVEEAQQVNQQLAEKLGQLQADLEELTHKYQAQVTDNAQLSNILSEREEKVMDLEMSVQRLSDNSVDKEALLDSMQSDKTALSRAIAQNKELKVQLAELQNGFVKMSNDNMEMMTSLSSEQHVSKELAGRLSQQEEELKEIREQLSQKEQQIRAYQETVNREDHKEHFTNQQLEDRLHHYEAQAQLVDTLQRELSSAQDTINALTNQNTILQTQNDQNGSISSTDEEASRMDSLNSSVRQLEMERNQIIDQLHLEQEARKEAQNKLNDIQTELANQVPATLNGDVITMAQFSALQHAMKQLETKYTKAMRDKADLTDSKEQLEHLIMQLQGETETIGEYITLYQQQRHILKQRQLEKDDYISRLARDREELTDKLGQLQALVMQLLGDRQMLHSYHDNQQASANHINPLGQVQKSPRADNTQEEWPDLTESDSDESAVEAIVGNTAPSGESETITRVDQSTSSPQTQHATHLDNKMNIPEDNTAQRIMHLLTELGSSNLVHSPSFSERNFLHCTNCIGRLLNV